MKDIKVIAQQIESLILEVDILDSKIEKVMQKALPFNNEKQEKLSEINSLKAELAETMREVNQKNVETNFYKISRRDSEAVKVLSEEKAIDWIKNTNGVRKSDYVRVIEKLDVNGFKKLAKLEIKKGKQIDGVEIQTTTSVVFKKK